MEKSCENCRFNDGSRVDEFPCKPCKANTSVPLKEWELRNDDEFIISLVDRIEALEASIS